VRLEALGTGQHSRRKKSRKKNKELGRKKQEKEAGGFNEHMDERGGKKKLLHNLKRGARKQRKNDARSRGGSKTNIVMKKQGSCKSKRTNRGKEYRLREWTSGQKGGK